MHPARFIRRHLGRSAAALWLLCSACGGRELIATEGAGGDAAGAAAGSQGGSSGAGASSSGGASAGSPSTGGSSSVGGSIGAGAAGRGGDTAGAGGAVCGTLACDPIKCAPGYQSVYAPGACCPTCEPTPCLAAPCASVSCASGSHLETFPGECCGRCVADPPQPTCDEGRRQYNLLREQLLTKYNTLSCSSGCTLLFESNRCTSGCGTAIVSELAEDFSRNLESLAASACASCPPSYPVPCFPVAPRCTASAIGCESYSPGR